MRNECSDLQHRPPRANYHGEAAAGLPAGPRPASRPPLAAGIVPGDPGPRGGHAASLRGVGESSDRIRCGLLRPCGTVAPCLASASALGGPCPARGRAGARPLASRILGAVLCSPRSGPVRPHAALAASLLDGGGALRRAPRDRGARGSPVRGAAAEELPRPRGATVGRREEGLAVCRHREGVERWA